jgi:hypothetical protein
MKTKIIEVAGKKYTLTATRDLINTINENFPELLNLTKAKTASEIEVDADDVALGMKIFGKLDALFYDMIRIAHPEITREKSSEILDAMLEEYDDVLQNLLRFAFSVFPEGTPKGKKKSLNWFQD